MALSTIERQAEKRLTNMLYRLVHPLIAIEQKIVSGQVSSGCQCLGVIGTQFVAGQHPLQHFIIAAIVVERPDDPIAPMPHMLLTIAKLSAESPPIAISPDVHPMPRPTLAMTWIVEQAIDSVLIPLRVDVVFKCSDLCGRRRNADQVEMQATQQDGSRCFGLRLEAMLLVRLSNEGIDRIAYPCSIVDDGHIGAHHGLKRPMRVWIGLGPLIGRRRCSGGDPGRQQFNLFARQWLTFVFGWHALVDVGGSHPSDDRAV